MFVPFSLAALGIIHLAAAQHTLLPWQVPKLYTFSPSGRPSSSPWYSLNATIIDPNFSNTTTECSTKWTYESPPYKQVHNCSEAAYRKWSFEILETNSSSEYPSPTTDFGLRFLLSRKGGREEYEGKANFKVGGNMSGLCAASGFCTWNLKEGVVVSVQQKRLR